MPRRRKPARLWQRPEDGAWIILDGGKQKRTGFGHGQDREAEGALAAYIAERERRAGPRHPSAVLIGEIIADYLDARADAKDTERLIYCAKALSPFFADLHASDVTPVTCAAYLRQRGVKPSTGRRELGMLAAALNHAHEHGAITHPVAVTLPPKAPTPRRALTRDEAARLLRAARSRREWHHVARLILIGLYTGTRPGAILGLRWRPSPRGGWVDLDAGVIYRRGEGEAETRKRRTAVRIPRPLLAHLRRWAGQGGASVIQWRGQGVEKLRHSMASVAAAAGLPGVTAHTLRHTAITWGIEGGMKMHDAASFFGLSTATIEAVYWDRSPHYQAQAVSVMERRGR